MLETTELDEELTWDEEAILNTIITHGIRTITPILTPSGIVYQGLEDFMRENELDWEIITKILDSMKKNGYFETKEQTRVIICPECGSSHVYSKFACPGCNSTELSRMEILEHSICGYTGMKKDFINNNRLICPKCNIKLSKNISRKNETSRKKSDYQRIGTVSECDSCALRFEKPTTIHICQQCSTNFAYSKARYETLYSYQIKEDIIQKLKDNNKLSILLIEDEATDAEIINAYLKKSKEKFLLEIVNTGKKGLEKIKDNLYDLILLDYHLPDMTGSEILEEIRAQNIMPHVIVLTGMDDREIAVKTMKLGASDYLIKSAELYKSLPELILKILKKNN